MPKLDRLAQLVRALRSHRRGRRFESFSGHMGNINSPEGSEIVQKQFKEHVVVNNHGIFTIGTKLGVDIAAVGRAPLETSVLPSGHEKMLAVRLRETAANPRLTSRLQFIIGKDERGTFFVENISQYKDEKHEGIPIRVSAPHFPNPITLFPAGRPGGESTRCPLGGTIHALRGVSVTWGDELKGTYFNNVDVNRATSDLNGWEARIRFDVVPSKR